MSEDLDPSTPHFREHPATYHEVMQKPDLHPGIHAHIARLAAGEHAGQTPDDQEDMPTLSEVIAAMRQEVASIDTLPYELDGPEYQPPEAIEDILASESYSKQDLLDFILTAKQLGGLYAAKFSESYGGEQDPQYSDVLYALRHANIEYLRDIWNSVDQSQNLRSMVEQTTDIESIDQSLWLMSEIYDCDTPLDLTEQHIKDSDMTVRTILDDYPYNSHEAIADSLTMETKLWPDDMDPVQASIRKRDWAARYLDKVAKLPADISSDFRFASHSRVSDPDTYNVDSQYLASVLKDVAYRSNKLGTASVVRLYEQAGIVNFDYYTLRQLHLMDKLLQGDPETIAHLNTGDTTVLFNDANGDYNAALSSNGILYETPNNRTLCFEVHAPENFDYYMDILREHDVKPSTLIISSHGYEHGLGMGVKGTAGEFTLTNNVYPEESIVQRALMRLRGVQKAEGAHPFLVSEDGLARIVNSDMQDSRGIDDNPEAIGRRRVILDACLQAKRTQVYQPNRSRERSLTRLGLKPSKYQLANKSTAQVVAQTIGNPDVDVYANQESFAAWATPHGLRHYNPDDRKTGSTVYQPISHLTVDKSGQLVETEISEITLRSQPINRDEEYES